MTTLRTAVAQTMTFDSVLTAPLTIVASDFDPSVTIDIDGTILVQMAAFLVALVMLHFLLYRPYLRTLDLRDENVEGSEEEAGEMGAQAEVLENKYDKQIRQARRDAQEVRESLRQQGLAERDEMHQEVRREVEAKLDEQRAEIEDHVQRARRDIEHRAEGLAEAMVDKLVPEAR